MMSAPETIIEKFSVVISMHNVAMEFPIKDRVAIVKRDQRGTRECYLNSIHKTLLGRG